jgi:hypothetical protein
MQISDYIGDISDEELQKLIIESMIREQKEKQNSEYVDNQPSLQIPVPEYLPIEKIEKDTPEERGVVIIDL